MANNRLFLVHRETGYAVCLGKNMADGWYMAPEKKKIDALFDLVAPFGHSGDWGSEDFILLTEKDAGWDYLPNDESGVLKLALAEPENRPEE